MELDDDIDREVGRRIRDLRLSKRMSMEELGRRIGVTYQQVQKYEVATNRISASVLYRAAAALETDIGYFFGVLDPQEETDAEARRLAVVINALTPSVRARIEALIATLSDSA